MQLFHKKKSCFFCQLLNLLQIIVIIISPQHAICAFKFDAIEMSTSQSLRDKFFCFFLEEKLFI